MTNPNLTYLEKRWLTDLSAETALKNFDKWSDKKLAWVLRHHDEDDIGDAESWLRDEFDYLLGFYSIMEIAVMIGFVDQLPAAFQTRHLPVLCNGSVRQFYEWNYPIDLPRRLRERMQSKIAYQIQSSAKLNAAFYQFLELTKVIERDEDVESFLWPLDGGSREDMDGECHIEKVSKALKKPGRLAQALQFNRKKQQSELDAALVGFCKFIQFCEGLDSLLDGLKDEPLVAEAMWLAHAYWFRQLKANLGIDLNLAFSSLVKWKEKMEPQEKKKLRLRVKELQQLMQRLALPPMTRWQANPKSKVEGIGGVTLYQNVKVFSKLVAKKLLAVKTKPPEITSQEKEAILGSILSHANAGSNISFEKISQELGMAPEKIHVVLGEIDKEVYLGGSTQGKKQAVKIILETETGVEI